jgi:hypothetical protein
MAGPPEIDIGSVGDIVREQARFADDVPANVEGLDAALRGLREPTLFVIEHAVGRPGPPEWVGAVVNQLNNELSDPVLDAICGRGRPAIKASRSLFDLLVTAKDIIASPAVAERYERHRWVVWRDALDLEAQTHRGYLTQAEAHRRRVNRREVEPKARAALSEYGPAFRRGWQTMNLRDRADQYGLGDDYEWYRLASAVLHGSAGGVLGTYVEFLDGPRMHRTGSALGLTPDALEFGLRWARMSFEALTAEIGEITSVMMAAIARVEALVAEFRQLIEDHDRQLWTTNPTHLEAFMLVTRWPGPPRWYLRIAGSNWVRAAIEPTGLSNEQRSALARMVVEARANFPTDGDVISIVALLDHRRIYPDPDKDWQYSPQMFQHASLRWDDPSQPRGFYSTPHREGS